MRETSVGLEKEMSPEEEEDIVQEMRYKYPSVKWPEVSAERLILSGFDHAIEGYKANVIWPEDEDDDPIIAAVTSDQYKFIRYEVTVKKFSEFLSKHKMWGEPLLGIIIIDGGRKLKVDARFENGNMELLKRGAKVGDMICPVAGFMHSIDLGWAYSTFSGAERLVCSNGMVATKLNLSMKKKHRSTLNVEAMNELLTPSFEEFPEQVEVWNQWGQLEVNALQAEELVDASFGPRHKEEILALPERSTGETVEQWMKGDKVNVLNLYNVLTQFITHDLESEVVRVKRSEEVANLFHQEFRKAA